jgi:hypothetical protein
MTTLSSPRMAMQAVYAGGRSSRAGIRHPFDNYATPKCATEALLAAIDFRRDRPVLEPACGDGYIVRVLRAHGFHVEASDIRTGPEVLGRKGVDFLRRQKPCDQLITNPPFGLVNEFIRHGAALCRGQMALMLRLTFLEGAGRYHLLRKFRPCTYLVLSQRLPYQTPDGRWAPTAGNFSHAWVVWNFAKRCRRTELRFTLLPHKEIEP